MTKRRGCRGRAISIVSAGVSGRNSYCELSGLTKVTNDETQDSNADEENNRVQWRFVFLTEQKMGR